jgi:ATP-dependent Clp protease ATP-binding subunit ClpA
MSRFRPEFINRIDEILFYERLSSPVISSIIDGLIRDINARLKDQSIEISLSPRLKEYLITEGYDSEL